jgi:hypothetical protein
LQTTGKNAIAAALGAIDSDLGSKAKNERSWRYGYVKHFVNGVKLSAVARDDALKVRELMDAGNAIRTDLRHLLRSTCAENKSLLNSGC